LVSDDRWMLYLRKQLQRARLAALLENTRLSGDRFDSLALGAGDRPTAANWVRRPEAGIGRIASWIQSELGEAPVHGLLQTIETELKYAGYIAQQQRQVDRLRVSESRKIPVEFCYQEIPGLSREVREKLERVRPGTLGGASAIPGVTPAAIAVLDVYLRLGH
jgi:tRNA uridine 5-carboxymethylaminomethyl modification enzyme